MITNWDLRTAARNLDIDIVPFFGDPDRDRGISTGREFGINPTCKEPVFVSLHEMGHIMLGHGDPHRLSAFAPVSLKEIEAHTIALALAQDLDLTPGTEYEPAKEMDYILGYAPAQIATTHVLARRKALRKAVKAIYNAGMRQEAVAA